VLELLAGAVAMWNGSSSGAAEFLVGVKVGSDGAAVDCDLDDVLADDGAPMEPPKGMYNLTCPLLNEMCVIVICFFFFSICD
jgi:hypothetical protein